ncbi:MAG: hypothetical protein HKO62_11670 [Gammaproteobacteria bacterium]|nr:hypothetical protein [Gammaproteobacteria bacterium]
MVAAAPAYAVEPLTASDLLAQCARHEADPASLETARCRSYLQGFMGGAFALRRARSGAPEKAKSTFTERAQRTRVGESRLGFGQDRDAGFCVPAELTLSEIVARLNRFALNQAKRPEMANALMMDFLRAEFACRKTD